MYLAIWEDKAICIHLNHIHSNKECLKGTTLNWNFFTNKTKAFVFQGHNALGPLQSSSVNQSCGFMAFTDNISKGKEGASRCQNRPSQIKNQTNTTMLLLNVKQFKQNCVVYLKQPLCRRGSVLQARFGCRRPIWTLQKLHTSSLYCW